MVHRIILRPSHMMAMLCLISSFFNLSIAEDVIAARMQQCRAGIVPNELQRRFGSNYDGEFREAVCGTWSRSHEEKYSASTSTGIEVLDILGISGDSRTSKETKTISRTEYCRDTRQKVALGFHDEFWSRVADHVSLEKWLDCIKAVTAAVNTSPKPVTVNITENASGPMLVSVQFNANYGGSRPKMLSVDTQGIRCQLPKMGGVIPSQGTGIAFSCRWANDTVSDAVIVVHTTRGDAIGTIERKLKQFLTIKQIKLTPAENVVASEKLCSAWLPHDGKLFHNWDNKKDGRCAALAGDRWCLGAYSLAVTSQPDGNGQFRRLRAHTPPECTDNTGSCNWNGGNLRAARWTISDHKVQADFYFGGNYANIRVCATQETYTKKDTEEEVKTFGLRRNETFSVTVPLAESHKLVATWRGGTPEEFPAGLAHRRIPIIGDPQQVGNQKIITYQVTDWAPPSMTNTMLFRNPDSRPVLRPLPVPQN